MRLTLFSPGRRWRVDQKPDDKYRDRPFDFLILGPGTKPDRKLCRIEVVGHDHPCCPTCQHGMESEYTHKHLKRYARLVEETAPSATSREATNMAAKLPKITKVEVLLTEGTDSIKLTLDAPTPFPEMQYKAFATIETQAGYGVKWCKDVLGVEPDRVINTRSSR
jgi:hypothetical protein